MKHILFLFIALVSIRAEAGDCNYSPRESLPPLFSNLPASVTGVFNCAPKFQNINILLAAKVPNLTDAGMTKFVEGLARTIDISAVNTEVIWVSARPLPHRQMLVKTTSAPNSNGVQIAMLHYAFAVNGKDGVPRVVVHSMDSAETMKIKSVLSDVQVRISGMDF